MNRLLGWVVQRHWESAEADCSDRRPSVARCLALLGEICGVLALLLCLCARAAALLPSAPPTVLPLLPGDVQQMSVSFGTYLGGSSGGVVGPGTTDRAEIDRLVSDVNFQYQAEGRDGRRDFGPCGPVGFEDAARIDLVESGGSRINLSAGTVCDGSGRYLDTVVVVRGSAVQPPCSDTSAMSCADWTRMVRGDGVPVREVISLPDRSMFHEIFLLCTKWAGKASCSFDRGTGGPDTAGGYR